MHSRTIRTDWPRFLLGLGLVYAIFQATATVLGSDRGQAGVVVGAIVVAAILSPPQAYLFELGGGTVWAPALVHFVVRGAIKVVTPEGSGALLPLVWMAASAVLP